MEPCDNAAPIDIPDMSESIRNHYSRAPFAGLTEPVWRPRRAPAAQYAPRHLKPWLDEPGSLTRRLRGHCDGQFNVRVLREGWQMPAAPESLALGLRLPGVGWVREVLLRCDEVPYVFARTVMPAGILRGHYRALRHLGRRPLGSLLFGRDTIRRGPLTMARLRPGHRLFEQAAREARVGEALWARRSIFRVGPKPLLVTEVFLPSLVNSLGGEA